MVDRRVVLLGVLLWVLLGVLLGVLLWVNCTDLLRRTMTYVKFMIYNDVPRNEVAVIRLTKTYYDLREAYDLQRRAFQ